MSSDDTERTVTTLWRRDCPAVCSRLPVLDGGNRKSSTVERRKSEGWFNETVGARGAESYY